jgi:hypothetical protein
VQTQTLEILLYGHDRHVIGAGYSEHSATDTDAQISGVSTLLLDNASYFKTLWPGMSS